MDMIPIPIMRMSTDQPIWRERFMMTEAWMLTRPDTPIMGTMRYTPTWTVTATFMELLMLEEKRIMWKANENFVGLLNFHVFFSSIFHLMV